MFIFDKVSQLKIVSVFCWGCEQRLQTLNLVYHALLGLITISWHSSQDSCLFLIGN